MKKTLPLLMVLLISCNQKSGWLSLLKPLMSIAERMNAVEVASHEVQFNRKYGEDAFQVFDAHLPKYENGTIPAVVLIVIHGGGWSMLDKSFMNGQIEKFKQMKKNVAILNINHRLAGINGANYESIIEDLGLFMEHVEENKSELNLSDDIVIYGFSSGGHLALEYSQLGNGNSKIKAVAAIAPPTDLTSEKLRMSILGSGNKRLTELLIGEPFEENPEAYRAASPIFKISKKSKPTILFYGEKDAIVHKEQVQNFSKLLTEKRVDNRLVVFNGIGHDLPDKENEVANELYRFMRER